MGTSHGLAAGGLAADPDDKASSAGHSRKGIAGLVAQNSAAKCGTCCLQPTEIARGHKAAARQHHERGGLLHGKAAEEGHREKDPRAIIGDEGEKALHHRSLAARAASAAALIWVTSSSRLWPRSLTIWPKDFRRDAIAHADIARRHPGFDRLLVVVGFCQ